MGNKIRFCPCNQLTCASEMKEMLRSRPDTVVEDHKCLNFCGQCLVEGFALVNGRNITGCTEQELMNNIFHYLGE
ncbi:hypothetical protein ADS79_15880 [Brevibacillus reuszeri]|uniref:DUF1450 domain-containing protein n=1 Tax=Brevibacillus reuszeri TaxID=54915 RepID=A0A0K9YNV7_9BACL|nr:hypothetical protein ADS79_15880 [Brevibacillus reuszeri]